MGLTKLDVNNSVCNLTEETTNFVTKIRYGEDPPSWGMK